MRIKLALIALAMSTTAMPAFAQRYQDVCGSVRKENQIAGAVIGGILGGVLGSNVAASGHRHDGTAVGAVVGALAGSEFGRGGTNCSSEIYGRGETQSGSYYGYNGYNGALHQPYPPPPDYSRQPYGGGYSSDTQYGSYNHDVRDNAPRYARLNDLDGYDSGPYNAPSDYAGRECVSATQVTRLPDGTEIRRPVEACRDAHYDGWTVED